MKLVVLALALFAFTAPASAAPKKFKRALVIAGGGITPGVSLGLIAGAEAGGFQPDVIIATCGGSLGAVIAHAYPTERERLAYLRSEQYHRKLTNLVQIETPIAFDLKTKLDLAESQPGVLPNLFSGNILNIPDDLGRVLPRESFASSPGRPRLVILGARANFNSSASGRTIGARPMFKTVYFTDADTAKSLKGLPSTTRKLFPRSHVDPQTDVVTNATVSQATRATISDPFFVNPGRIGNNYYFTGAVDLFPIETAKAIADEVLVTYPSVTYDHYENLAIKSSFGFDQQRRSDLAAGQRGVHWINVTGMTNLAFDPSPLAFVMVNNIPESHDEFAERVREQYEFGYQRAFQAARARR